MWGLVNFILRNNKILLFVNFLRSIKKYGIKKVFSDLAVGIAEKRKPLKKFINLSRRERMTQTHTVFKEDYKISVIVSLYNTPKHYLEDMLNSITAQTYNNYELCLVDGSDKEHSYVRQTCATYTQNNIRIKYRKIDKNFGVSERLNIAIEMSTGDYIGLVHQSDILHPSALYEIINAICNEKADFIYTDEALFSDKYYITIRYHKPCYAIDTLCSHNYISHFTVFARKLIEKGGMFRSEYDGSQDYDLNLRYTDIASKIINIQKILYFKRDDKKNITNDIKRKIEKMEITENVIKEYLDKRNKPAKIESIIELPDYYRVIYELTEHPKVSIIIPNKDCASMLRKCISSIIQKTTYSNYEIIIVENNSRQDNVFALYEEIKRFENIRIVYWEKEGFNFSAISNFGVDNSEGKHLIFLNNDVTIISPNWIEEMLMYSQRSDVGAVGTKLYYFNGSVQHAGVILGLGGLASHIYQSVPRDTVGYMGKLKIVQNMSIVTAACLMIKRQLFDEVGRFDPVFPNSFNDFDLCLKLRKAGYLNVWTPYAEAFHLESRSRGYNVGAKKRRKLAKDIDLFRKRWHNEIAAGDQYYNCNLSLDKNDYRYK